MRLPVIQAESVKAKLGVESKLGNYNIHTQRADLEIQTIPAQISAPTPMPVLDIDQDRMWDALNGGKPVAFINRIYSQMPDIALQAIAKRVEDGNRLGDLRIKRNPIPDIAYENATQPPERLQIFGPASVDNIDIHFTIPKPDIHIERGGVNMDVQAHRPEISYNRGSVNIYMQQYPSVKFSVANLDVTV